MSQIFFKKTLISLEELSLIISEMFSTEIPSAPPAPLSASVFLKEIIESMNDLKYSPIGKSTRIS